MPIRLVTALVLLISVAGVQAQTMERVTIKGAYGIISIPKDWNGSLILYAHGYTADKSILQPIPGNLTQANQLLIPGLFFVPPGYATAVTTFRSVGWYLKDSIKDVENLRRYFVQKHGKPKHTYVWGHSGGGLVTEALIEYFPDTYEGAAPMCGPGAGGRRNFDGAYDLRVLFEYICKDVPESRFVCGVCDDGKTTCLVDGDCPAGEACSGLESPAPPEDGLSAQCTAFLLDHPERFDETTGGFFVQNRVDACFGGASPSARQAANRDFYLRVSHLPPGFIESATFFGTVGLAEIVHRRTGGKHPWGNIGVEYSSADITAQEAADLNDGIHRSNSDADAVRYMQRWFEPRGQTKSKVITVHALDDGLVLPENEDKYRQAFEAAGREDQLVQVFTPTGGHCLFLSAWTPALNALTAWVEEGRKPSASDIDRQCKNCLTTITPGSWGTRVVERRQKGAPVRRRVCDGALDCPSDSACVVRRHRCR